VPVAGDWDAAVTHLRITPQGAFASGADRTPYFTLRYRVRVL